MALFFVLGKINGSRRETATGADRRDTLASVTAVTDSAKAVDSTPAVQSSPYTAEPAKLMIPVLGVKRKTCRIPTRNRALAGGYTMPAILWLRRGRLW